MDVRLTDAGESGGLFGIRFDWRRQLRPQITRHQGAASTPGMIQPISLPAWSRSAGRAALREAAP